MNKLSAIMGLASALIVSVPLGASAQPVRNVVLVHGAFVGASSWDKVAILLRKKGFHVTEVHNPLTSLADDVAATRKGACRAERPDHPGGPLLGRRRHRRGRR